jgi:hypothetical protein
MMNILDLFFALRPENRPVVLDSGYYPRGEKPSIPVDEKSPTIGINKLPINWNIGDPF